MTLPEEIKVEKTADGDRVSPREDTQARARMWGMSRTLIDNQIKGVVDGYAQTLEIHGVGFRAALKGKDLTLQLGFSHEINYKIPAGIDDQAGRRQAGSDPDLRYRQAEGRPGRRRDARLPAAGALSGQGCALSGRIHPAQRRQEEVARNAMSAHDKQFQRRRSGSAGP